MERNKRKELLFYYGVVLWGTLSLVLIICQEWYYSNGFWTIMRCIFESALWAGGACIVIAWAKICVKDMQRHITIKNILFGLIGLELLCLYYALFRNFFSAGYLSKYLSILVVVSIGAITVFVVRWKKTEK